MPMKLFLTAFLSLFFVAETQAGWICSFLHRRERQSCVPLYLCQPQCQPRFYYDCVPCPLPVTPLAEEEKVVLSEDLSGSLPLYGYYDTGLPPTGHETYFGGGGSSVIPPSLLVYTPYQGGYGGFGFGGGWGGGNIFYGVPSVFNYYTTVINEGNTIINITNPCPTDHPCPIPPLFPPYCPPYHPNCPTICPPYCLPCDKHDPCDNPNPDPHTIATPEPSGLILMATGIPGLIWYYRRKR